MIHEPQDVDVSISRATRRTAAIGATRGDNRFPTTLPDRPAGRHRRSESVHGAMRFAQFVSPFAQIVMSNRARFDISSGTLSEKFLLRLGGCVIVRATRRRAFTLIELLVVIAIIA